MSLFRKPKHQRTGNTWESIVDFFNGGKRRRAKGGRQRRLMIDPLEERMLLSVVPNDVVDQLVSQTIGAQTTGTESFYCPTGTTSSQAVACDNNGDFVAAWTRYDSVLDPETGNTLTDANIYARYFTDETQRITLPSGTTRFSLVYGGHEVQKLLFTTITPTGSTSTTNIVGMFRLAIDLNNDGAINDPYNSTVTSPYNPNAATEVTKTISFDETLYNSTNPTQNPANLIQEALRSLGGVLADVQVTASGPREYLVEFGDAMQGQNVPVIQLLDPAWSSGDNPGCAVTIERQSTAVGILSGNPRITVNSATPTDTALSIQSAFDTALGKYTSTDSDGYAYTTSRVKVTTVTKADGSIDPYSFDITFVADLAKTDQLQLLFGQVQTTSGSLSFNQISALNANNIKTLKETSQEFRVNPVEPDNVYTIGLDLYNQTAPAVAMDTDGDFVITWVSEVPDSVNQGSKTDIFARRYTPSALVSSASGFTTQNLIISGTSLSVVEGTTNNTFKVSLAGAPTTDTDGDGINDVTVTIARDTSGTPDTNLTVYDASSAAFTTSTTLIFTAANWNVPQAITFRAAQDLDKTNGSASFILSATDYDSQTLVVTENDDDPAAIQLSSNDISVVEGTSNTFTVSLNANPNQNLTVYVIKGANSDPDITINGANATTGILQLSFNSTNWNNSTPAALAAHTVTLNAADDTDATQGTAYFYVYVPGNDAYTPQILTAREIEVPKIVVSNNNLKVTEGGSVLFTVTLENAPTGIVTASISQMGTADPDFTTSATTLIFDNTNPNSATYWSNPHTVLIIKALDTDTTNDSATFNLYIPGYANQAVTVTEVDQNPALYVISSNTTTPTGWTMPNPLMIPEGGSASFDLRLAVAPTLDANLDGTIDDVVVNIASLGDPDLTCSPASITFSPTNWNTPQAVTINARADTGNVNGSAVFTLTASDPNYGTLNFYAAELDPAMIVLSNMYIDPTTALIVNNVQVLEGGTSNFTVSLASLPAGEVRVNVTAATGVGQDTDLTAVTQTLYFNRGNWNTPQAVTLRAAIDGDAINGSRNFILSFAGAANMPITVVNATEIDIPSISATPTTQSMLENVTTGTYSIATSAATGTFTVAITKEVGGDADLTTASSVSVPSGGSTPITVNAGLDTDTLMQASFLLTAAGCTVNAFTGIEISTTTWGYPVEVMTGNSTPGLVSVAEGGTNSMSVKLAVQPTATTTVSITPSSSSDVDITVYDSASGTYQTSTTLTFTTSNWNQWQTVTFKAAVDADALDGQAAFDLSCTMGTYTFASMLDPWVTVQEIDAQSSVLGIQVGGVAISPSQIAYLEVLEGAAATFDVVLPTAPTTDTDGDGINDVWVNITRQYGSDSDLYAAPLMLQFTANNYATPQTVKILAKSDKDTTNGTATFAITANGYISRTITAVEKDYVQGVRPLGSAFQVNTFTVDKQYEPSIGMDRDGNFVISWSNEGQDIGFFNGIVAQRFNRDGDRLGSEFMVNTEVTGEEHDSYVAVSPDGHILITWVYGTDTEYVRAKVYDAQGIVISLSGDGLPGQFEVERGFNPTAAWDYGNNYVIAFDVFDSQIANDHNVDNDGNIDFNRNNADITRGVYAIRYSLYDDRETQEITSGHNVILNMFRINSADIPDAYGATTWPYFQGNNGIAIDADGDITAVYDGFSGGDSRGFISFAVGNASYDLNTYIYYLYKSTLWTAQSQGATDAQLAQLKANLVTNILGSLAGLEDFIGDPNGVMFTQFDTDPNNPDGTVWSDHGTIRDMVVNSPDLLGAYQSYYIILDSRSISGGFTLRVANPNTAQPGYTDVAINPVYFPNRGPINVDDTRRAIEDALNGAEARVGENSSILLPNPVLVRTVTAAEITTRTGTDWDFTNYGGNPYNSDGGAQIIYEVTFANQSENNQITIALQNYRADQGMKQPDPVDRSQDTDAQAPQIVREITGNFGTAQQYSSVATQSNGSFVAVWTQYDVNTATTAARTLAPYYPLMSNNMQTDLATIHFRTYTETTDTVGPNVTDLLLSDGTRLRNNAQVLTTLQYIVVSFDEAMMTSGTGSVTNTANWALLKDGVNISGGIKQIYYGMNMASQLSTLGIYAPASNRYEAVILLDGNGGTSGTPALSTGHYQITALSSLKDVAGNPLGRTGYSVNGASFSREFDVAALPSGSETLINTNHTSGDQSTAYGQQAVASDGNGRYVAVWVSNETGQQGVWARMYTTTTDLVNYTPSWGDLTSRTSNFTPVGNEFQVSSDLYAGSVAVAMDSDGDFVVTWSSKKNDPNDTGGTSWDVYARMYNANKSDKLDSDTGVAIGEFRVNTETADIQNHPSVGMDADGDFIIAWQSMGQDGSGYGVYAQRYDPAGNRLGGANEAQLLSFIGRPQGTFRFQWVDALDSSGVTRTSEVVTISGEPYENVDAIKAALEGFGMNLEVEVTAITSTEILVRFLGAFAAMDVSQLTIVNASNPALPAVFSGDSGARIEVSTEVDGISSEIQVNDTIANDQMNPSVGASLDGSFVITWTGYGQDGDASWESSIYAKQFSSNDVLRSTQSTQTKSDTSSNFITSSDVVTADDPANHVVQAGTGYDGVVEIIINTPEGPGVGSGTLLLDRKHILTAAHVVYDALAPSDVTVLFTLATGNVAIAAKQIFIHPDYIGDPFYSPDVAIIELTQTAPAGVTGFDIYRGSDALGQVFSFYGYGRSGTGTDGVTLPTGTKRYGQNLWEVYGDALGFSSGLLTFDFDNGQAANDALAVYLGLANLGLGENLEAMVGGGDSGGPSFLSNGLIAAVTTGQGTIPSSLGGADIDDYLNSSFGELGLMTSVSAYAEWIDAIVSAGAGPEFLVNQITTGVQQWSSVACDADGDFVITWTSYGQDGTGNGAGPGANGQNGVYARRFSADGTTQSDDFKVNTFSANNQQHSQVSMDADGDFVITWESFQDRPAVGSGLPDSPNSYGIYAQRYAATAKLGTIATLGPNGEIGSEFRLNSTTDGDQRYPSIALDATGDMVVVWSGNGAGDSQGVFYRRFDQHTDTAGAFVTDVVNQTASATLVSTGTNNDIVVTSYDSNYYDVNVYFVSSSSTSVTYNSATKTLTIGIVVGTTTAQNVVDLVNNNSSVNSIFHAALDPTDGTPNDGSGMVAVTSGTLQKIYTTIYDNTTLSHQVSTFTIDFDEELSKTGGAGGLQSITNLNNWTLTKDGSVLVGGIYSVQFGFEKAHDLDPTIPASKKYEAVVTFDGDFDTSGSQQLGQGDYVLTISGNVEDKFGNALDGNLDGTPGGNYVFNFKIDVMGQGGTVDDPVGGDTSGGSTSGQQNAHTSPETPGAVAVDADGHHIVVWTAFDATAGYDRVYFQIFDADGSPADLPATGVDTASITPVTSSVTGHQRYASVACDADGDFVVTWSGYGQEGDSALESNIYARRFDSMGQALDSKAFRVNSFTAGKQKWSNVAMDTDGDFVVTWSSYGQEKGGTPGLGYGVYAARYNSFGNALNPEFQVNANTSGDQYHSSAVLLEDGWFIVAFEGQNWQTNYHDIFVRLFSPTGTATGLEQYITSSAQLNYRFPDIAATPYGDSIVVAYQADEQSGNGWEIKATSVGFDRTNGVILPFTGAASYEISVNSTVTGDQEYASIAMDYNGAFVVSWSGFGNRTGQSDLSGDGVFYQRFTAYGGRISGERRANVATEGNQYIASVASDAAGNVVIAFTGVKSTDPGQTVILKTVTSVAVGAQVDNVGAVITDVLLPDRTRLIDGDSLASGTSLSYMIVVLSENMFLGYGSSGTNSIVNPTNWALYRNGSEIIGAISSITFAYNANTRKYEAKVTFNTSTIFAGADAFNSGEYQLMLRGNVLDKATGAANPLYRTTFVNSVQNYTEHFVIASGDNAQYGQEFRVNGIDADGNSDIQYLQTLGAVEYGSYNVATNQSTQSLAVDHDGDFVVVWTSFGQDDTSDPNSAGVYLRVYNRNNVALTNDILVNNVYTKGNQCNASVAMDADGDFIVVWQGPSYNLDGTVLAGGGIDIFARRFDAAGTPLGNEFRVNTNYTGDQIKPAVAVNNAGNFVIVWAAKGQNFSYFNDIHGQIYNYNGEQIGSEFRVNSTNLPNATGCEINPTVAMDANGNFAVAWEQPTWDLEGEIYDTYIQGRLFDAQGNPRVNNITGNNLEFRVDASDQGNDFISDNNYHLEHQRPCDNYGVHTVSDYMRTARNPAIVMDSAGNFIIAWESYEDNDVDEDTSRIEPPGTGGDYPSADRNDKADSYGIYYRRFDVNGAAMTAGDHNANPVFTIYGPAYPQGTTGYLYTNGEQINASLALDANGNLSIVWAGNGSTFDTVNSSPTQHDSDGVIVRNFTASSYTPNLEGESIDLSTVANKTISGLQYSPTIGKTTDGSYVVAWSGSGVGDSNGIFARRFKSTTDTAGPMVSDYLLSSNGTAYNRIDPNNQVIMSEGLRSIKVIFDEAMMNSGTGSAGNKDHYRVLKDGVDVTNFSVVYNGLDTSLNKYSATITFNSPLTDGHYQLIVVNSIRDVVGNPLQSTALNSNGANMSREFDISTLTGTESRVNVTTAGEQTASAAQRAVASDGSGRSVVVWVTTGQGLYARMYDAAGNATTTSDILVSADAYAAQAAVAMDGDGDWVVTWSSNKLINSQDYSWNVYAKLYDAAGNLKKDLSIKPVNQHWDNIQNNSSVAMDVDGDFVIVWQSLEQDDSGYGIYAQRYDPSGKALSGTNEAQIITLVGRPTGAFTLHWEGDTITTNDTSGAITVNGEANDALASAIKSALTSMGASADVTVLTSSAIMVRFKDEYGNKNVPQITVASSNVSGDSGARITVTTQVQGVSSEILVNNVTVGNQIDPTIAMNQAGEFVITWTGYGQNGDAAWESNIYAKQFLSNDYLRQSTQYDSFDTSYSVNAATWVVTADDPAGHVVAAGAGYDGVVQVIVDMGPLGVGSGTGSLLLDRYHVLTAAHVVADETGQLASNNISVMFTLAGGDVVIAARQVVIHPDYMGDPFVSPDLAIITLAQAAPAGVSGYDIYRDTNEIGQIFTFCGYGTSGVGATGATLPYGTKRVGQNKFEVYGDQIIAEFNPNLLGYDFDNGLSANDTFGVLFGIQDLGLGNAEASGAPGDSGGPSFISGKIAAVTTGGVSFPSTDVTGGIIDSSFGDTGYHTRVSVYAPWIDAVVGGGGGADFIVNQLNAGLQKWSSVAMDADGDFVVTWTSYGQDGTGTGYGAGVNGLNGVYARRFNSDGSEASGDFKVNTITANNQQNSKVAMDADGDFVIVWESFQDRPSTASGLPDSPNSYGIYAQRYAATDKLATAGYLGANGEIGGEFRLNITTDYDQRYPAVALDATGDLIAVWSGYGSTDPTGVYLRRYNAAKDVAGPFVTEVLNSTSTPIYNNAILTTANITFLLRFDEELSTLYGAGGDHSVTNLSNWQLAQNGTVLTNGVATVVYNPISTTNSYCYVVVTFADLDPDTAGVQLVPGQYTLTILDNVQDVAGNALDGNYDGTPGGYFLFNFSIPTSEQQVGPQLPPTITPVGPPPGTYIDNPVNTTKTGAQDSPAVASNAEGSHVVVWVTTTTTAGTDIMFQLYDKYGQRVGSETLASTVSTNDQVTPDVAMDRDGNFVIVWAGYGSDANGEDASGIWGQRFDYTGRAIGVGQFRINPSIAGIQTKPSIAMDASGDFVVTWTGYNGTAAAETDRDGGIYARRYNKSGTPLGADEFLVNGTTQNRQDNSDVAIDSNGNFVVVWTSDQQDGGALGIYGRRFNSSGSALGAEFRLNNYTQDTQLDPHVAMGTTGNYVIAWTSFNQDGSGYGVYARRYNAAGAALDANEFRVNQNALNWQYQSAVSCDANGNFVVVWTTYGQESEIIKDYGVFARMYRADGSDWLNPGTNAPFGEFRINAIIAGNQVSPEVAMDNDGDFAVAWVGPDNDSTGIYSRVMVVNPNTYSQSGNQSGATQQNNGSSNTNTNQPQSFVLSGPTSGTYSPEQIIQITWTAANAPANGSVSLCLDKDGQWNNNEQWIEIGQVSATNGSRAYSFDVNGLASGTYYVAGYMYDNDTKAATYSRLGSAITISVPMPTFTLTAPTSGTYTADQSMSITWTAANAPTSGSISLCLDKDGQWNGNEKWIEIGKVAAANGSGSYDFNVDGLASGTYYVAGYMYDNAAQTAIYSRLGSAITISVPMPTFTLTAPTSGTYAADQSMSITWTAANAPASGSISLCLDKDGQWNGNEKWIEIGKVAAANGSGSYVYNTSGVASGTYYIGGYMYDHVLNTPYYSRLSTPISIGSTPSQSRMAMSMATEGNGENTIDSPASQDPNGKEFLAHQGGTDGASLVDKVFMGNTSEQYMDDGNANNMEEDIYAPVEDREEITAIDRVLQDQDTWLESLRMA